MFGFSFFPGARGVLYKHVRDSSAMDEEGSEGRQGVYGCDGNSWWVVIETLGGTVCQGHPLIYI